MPWWGWILALSVMAAGGLLLVVVAAGAPWVLWLVFLVPLLGGLLAYNRDPRRHTGG